MKSVILILLFFMASKVGAMFMPSDSLCQKEFRQIKEILQDKSKLKDAEKITLAKVFLDSKDEILTCLKIKIDYDENTPTLLQIFKHYFSKKDRLIKKLLIDHFLDEGKKWRKKHSPLKGLASDIDDTIYPGYYHAVASGERGILYENVLKFHHLFDYFAIVTARPFSNNRFRKTHQELNEKKIQNRALCMGRIWGIWFSSGRLSQKICELKSLFTFYPEIDFTWVGDSGDRDIDAGIILKKHFPNQLKYIFIKNIDGTKLKENAELIYFREYQELFDFFQSPLSF